MLGLVLAVAAATTALGDDPRLPATVEARGVEDAKRTLLGLYLNAREAAAALAAHGDIVLIDVRSRASVLRDGIAAPTSRNIPLLAPTPGERISNNDAATLRIDPRFLERVMALVGGGGAARMRTILVICPDGSHSALAVDLLADNGFENVYLIVDGIGAPGRADGAGAGWRSAGLPWLAQPRPDQLSE